MITLIWSIALLGCMWAIWKISDKFENATNYLGRNMGEGVKGATFNAIGSSLPELLTTFIFLFILKDAEGFANGLATTAGSGIFNSLVIPGMVIFAVSVPFSVSRKVVLRDGIALIIAEVILIFLLGTHMLTWMHGLGLMILYLMYFLYLSRNFDTGVGPSPEEEQDLYQELNGWNPWALLVATTVAMGGACYVLCEAVIHVAEAANVATYFVSVILAAAATSVPDTFISIRDAKKGNYEDSVANAFGSNIFDITFSLGLPVFLFCLIHGDIPIPEALAWTLQELRIALLILTVSVLALILFTKKLTKFHGAVMISGYLTFVAFVCYRVWG